MSQENVERIRRGYEAFARGDVDAVLELLHPDVDWHPAIAPILGVGNGARERSRKTILHA
jgi:ketosteroid isomerase-like protein